MRYPPGVIEVNGLVFAYPGAKGPAVNDLEFAVDDLVRRIGLPES